MNKRQKKKLLCQAIRELNNDVAKDLGEPKITDKAVLEVYKRIKNDKRAVDQTIMDYKVYILWQK